MEKKYTFLLTIFSFAALFFVHTGSVFAGSAILTWNAVSDPDLASYKIYYGTTTRTGTCPQGGYTDSLNVGDVTTHTFQGLTDGLTYYFSLTAIDDSGNESCFSSQISKLITDVDATAPLRSQGLPSGALGARTTQTTLSITTNENATCKYSTVADIEYASMTNLFMTTGSMTHSTNVSGLSKGNTYTYYVRCMDGSSNVNTDDYKISFSVSNAAVHSTSGGGGGGGGGSSSKNKNTTKSTESVTSVSDAGKTSNTNTTETSTSDATHTQTTKTTQARHTFTAHLELGVSHPDVKALQQFLNASGYTVATVGAGSSGSETAYYGLATRAAVIKFQQAYNLADTSSYGLVGPKTRAKLQELQSEVVTPTTQTTDSTADSGLSLESLVNLFIALNIIPKEKAQLALNILKTKE